jgi:protein-tyrosine phosphatase
VAEVTEVLQKMNADKVGKNLWVGGLPTDPSAVDKNFDALVLAAKEFQDVFPVHKFPGTQVIHAPMNDAKPSQAEADQAVDAGVKVMKLNLAGKKVLVTCAAGVNRSALIAAIAMMSSGLSADDAISRIRKHREPPSGSTPLKNQHFVQMLKSLDEQLNSRDD